MTANSDNNANLGILFLVGGVFAISINDMLIKELSGAYPLHELTTAKRKLVLSQEKFRAVIVGER